MDKIFELKEKKVFNFSYLNDTFIASNWIVYYLNE